MSIPEKSEKEALKELGKRVEKCKTYYAAQLSVRQQTILTKITEYLETKIPKTNAAKLQWYEKLTILIQSLDEWHVGEIELHLGNSLWILLNQIRASKMIGISNNKFMNTFKLRMRKEAKYQSNDTFGLPQETPTETQVVSFYDSRSLGSSSTL